MVTHFFGELPPNVHHAGVSKLRNHELVNQLMAEKLASLGCGVVGVGGIAHESSQRRFRIDDERLFAATPCEIKGRIVREHDREMAVVAAQTVQDGLGCCCSLRFIGLAGGLHDGSHARMRLLDEFAACGWCRVHFRRSRFPCCRGGFGGWNVRFRVGLRCNPGLRLCCKASNRIHRERFSLLGRDVERLRNLRHDGIYHLPDFGLLPWLPLAGNVGGGGFDHLTFGAQFLEIGMDGVAFRDRGGFLLGSSGKVW